MTWEMVLVSGTMVLAMGCLTLALCVYGLVQEFRQFITLMDSIWGELQAKFQRVELVRDYEDNAHKVVN